MAMSKQKDPAKNVDSMNTIIQDFHLDTIKDAEDIDVLKGIVAITYLGVNDQAKFEYYIGQIKNKFNQTSYLNMGATYLMNNKTNLKYAEEIAEETMTLYFSYKDNPAAKPTEFPLEAWNRFMKMAMYPYCETYATTLHANGKDKKALTYLEMALKEQDMDNLDPVTAKLYTILLLTDGQEGKAWDVLLKMEEAGSADDTMQAQFRKLCLQRTGSEARTNAFLDSIHRNVAIIYRTALTKKMINDTPAPDFTITDLNGKNVSLSEMKGKVVIVDFWATWCWPCIASMPAMDILRNKYPDVVFLFIATQDKAATVNDYTKKHTLPVHTFLDKPAGDVANSFKVTGIPCKAVIDRNGNLRFLTTGYSSDQELIHEMSTMIDIVNML